MFQNRSSTIVVLAATVVSFLSACGGEEAAGPCGEEPVAEKTDAAPAAETKAAPVATGESWTSLDDAALATYGERVFMAKGSNTCNDCHGADGKKGRLEQAANLTEPGTWRVAQALGGDAEKINTALTYLISNGGKKFNGNFATDNPDLGWDWAKTEATSYDIQMFGVTQSSTMSEIKKIRKDLKKEGIAMEKTDMTAFGTKAVISYLRTIEVK
jgi:mono/diheme cytochrome c family protein